MAPKDSVEKGSWLWEAGIEVTRNQTGLLVGLDTKTGILVGFVAASLAEIIGALFVVATENPRWFVELNWWPKGFLGFGLLLALAAFVSGLWAMRPLERSPGFDFEAELKKLRTAQKIQDKVAEENVIVHFESGYAKQIALLESWEKNRDALRSKGALVWRCTALVLVSIVFLTVGAVWAVSVKSPTPGSTPASSSSQKLPTSVAPQAPQSTQKKAQGEPASPSALTVKVPVERVPTPNRLQNKSAK